MASRTPTHSTGRRIGGWLVALLVMGVLAALIASVVAFIARWPERNTAGPLPAQGCMVTVDDFTTTLSWEQSYYVSIIVGESIRRGLPARAATIALVTAYQESGIRNLDYGDRDSVGLFQQRPSQGWGSVEQIMDPWYSAGQFYDHLVRVPDWETGVINDVAQAVQRSGHPDEYGKHEQKGRAWASALTGYSPATVSCVDRSADPANAAEITDFVERVWGEQVHTATAETGALQLAADANGAAWSSEPADTTTWSVAQLLMLRGQAAGVTGVQAAEQSWANSPNAYTEWQPATPGPAPVVLTLRS